MSNSIVVVGGGITGLVAAYLAAQDGREVTVLEAGTTFGGLLNTFEINGGRLECYYHHFFTHDAEIHWLIRELGLEEHLTYRNSTMGIYRGGRIYPFDTPFDLLRFSPLGFADKVRFGLSSAYLAKLAHWRCKEEIAAGDWFARWAGSGAMKAIWRPMLDIKFGPYADQVPLSWMIGRMRQRLNSRQRGAEKLGYLEGSLQVLLDALLSKLRDMGVSLVSEAQARRCRIRNSRMYVLETAKGDYEDADFLFTIPTTVLASLLREDVPAEAAKLDRIQYFGAICTILEMTQPLSEIYWLNVADEGFPFGAVIEQTNLVEPAAYGGSHVAYLSRYFAPAEPLARLSRPEVIEHMLPAVKRLYPDFRDQNVKNMFVFKAATAAPVCDLGFSRKVPACRGAIDRLYLCNMSHIYPDERSVNNSIRIAAEACRVMGVSTAQVPANASLSGQIGFDHQE